MMSHKKGLDEVKMNDLKFESKSLGRNLWGTLLVLAFVCAGCMTCPYIDESLAVIESDPLSAKYAPPAHELVEEDDLGAEGLLGTWTTSYDRYWRRTGDSLSDNHPSKRGSQPISESYTFMSNGTYVQCTSYGSFKWSSLQNTNSYRFRTQGKWTYSNGTLTLQRETRTYEVDSILSSNKKWNVSERCSYKIGWLEGDEIILKEESLPPTLINGRRVCVEVDSHGVRTERIFNIQESENGRERGWIEEATSLVRFKKTSVNN